MLKEGEEKMSKFQDLDYDSVFKEYPDIVNTEQMCEMLGSICIKTGYQLLKEHKIEYFHIGRKYMIPKVCVIDYILSSVQSKPNRKIEKEDNLNYHLIVQ